MKIFHDPDQFIKEYPTVITTGSFDGVHLGHKVIINRLCKLAQEINGESVLITFHPHPRKVLYPESAGKNLFLINSQQEKIKLLESTGLDNLLIINFTPEFSHMTSFDFIRKILVNKLNARKIIVGFNHHFGYNQEGGYEELKALGLFHGFDVEEIPEQDIENETVSSTRIRRALLEGKIQRANAYLDHFYCISGLIQPLPEQDKLSYYHIKIEEDCKLIPPEGTYAVSISSNGVSVKALVLIENHEQEGYTQNLGRYVKISPLGPFEFDQKQTYTLHFHRLIREQQNIDYQDIVNDCNEIIDLIY